MVKFQFHSAASTPRLPGGWDEMSRVTMSGHGSEISTNNKKKGHTAIVFLTLIWPSKQVKLFIGSWDNGILGGF